MDHRSHIVFSVHSPPNFETSLTVSAIGRSYPEEKEKQHITLSLFLGRSSEARLQSGEVHVEPGCATAITYINEPLRSLESGLYLRC
jgi:hypothetical protein